MADDPSVVWRQSTPFGIYHDDTVLRPEEEGAWSAWYSGRTKDVLVFEDASVIAAVQHGGVWRATANGSFSICLSHDWPAHRFERLVFGPGGPDHVFAGGESLWVTDPTVTLPFASWRQITSFTFGTIWDMLVIGRTLVVAADQGVWWSDIPPPPTLSFVWRQALVDTTAGRQASGAFFSLAEGRADREAGRGARYATILAGSAGMGLPAQHGLFLGAWEPGGDLVFGRTKLMDGNADVSNRFDGTGDIAVASCEWNRERAYAAADRNDRLDLLLRSRDGGRTWTACGAKLLLDTTKDLFAKSDHQAGHQTLSVAANDPELVAFGWFDTYVSLDGGDSWESPGVNDDVNSYDNNHVHADIHRVKVLPPREPTGLLPAHEVIATGDGGIASIQWGQGATFIEGGFRAEAYHGDLEAVVLEGNTLVHYRRPSDTLEWERYQEITNHATGPGCIIESDLGDGPVGNFEVLVPEGSELAHWWRDNTDNSGWHRSVTVSSSVTGPACFIQSDYPFGRLGGLGGPTGLGGHGNFEAVVLEETNLIHYWHDSSDPQSAWHRTATITEHAASQGCIIQSDYPLDAEHGNFEVVVLEDERGVFGRALVHYWRDNALDQAWHGPFLITDDAVGPGWFFQGDYPKGGDHGNFELFIQEGDQLAHWIRDNQAAGTPWRRVTTITGPGEKVSGPACAFQGNYGGDDDHGNFELLAPTGGRLFHYWRDAAGGDLAWERGAMITHHAFHFQTRWNRLLPTLMFNRFVDSDLSHGQFGISTTHPGLVAGGLQDHGVVASISGTNGTPWVTVGGGDGHEALFPASSSRSFATLPGGRLLVWNNNKDTLGGAALAWVGDPGHGTLAADNPEVIPVESPDPTSSPPPPAAAGLIPNPILGRVSGPAFLLNNAALMAIGAPQVAANATRAPIYGLFTEGPFHVQPEGDHPKPVKAGWRFIGALTTPAVTYPSWPVTALASADGSTVFIGVLVSASPITRIYRWGIFALDVATQTATQMPMSAAVGSPKVNGIEAISDDEAYAATDEGAVLIWDGSEWDQPGTTPSGTDRLIGLATDATSDPTVIFVATDSDVYISRDGTRSWQPATKGLPRSIECTNIHQITGRAGVHLHLSTYGRSLWVADVGAR